MKIEKETQLVNQSLIENEELITGEILLPMQFEYVEHLMTKKTPFLTEDDKELDFHSLLNKYTDLSNVIYWSYVHKFGGFPSGESLNFVDFDKKVMDQLMQLCKDSPNEWYKKALKVVKDTIESWQFTGDITTINEDKKIKSGFLSYTIANDIKGLEGIKDFGMSKGDQYMLIHIPILKTSSASSDDSFTFFPERMFRPIAQDLNEKYPDSKGVVAVSWIVDSPIGKRIGFHEFRGEKFEDYFHGDAFWGQFFDQNGVLNQKRFSDFLKTGKPSFTVKGGFLSKQEFLSKFNVTPL